jgi:hypothetical protein
MYFRTEFLGGGNVTDVRRRRVFYWTIVCIRSLAMVGPALRLRRLHRNMCDVYETTTFFFVEVRRAYGSRAMAYVNFLIPFPFPLLTTKRDTTQNIFRKGSERFFFIFFEKELCAGVVLVIVMHNHKPFFRFICTVNGITKIP